jgi:hypothetical protein
MKIAANRLFNFLRHATRSDELFRRAARFYRLVTISGARYFNGSRGFENGRDLSLSCEQLRDLGLEIQFSLPRQFTKPFSENVTDGLTFKSG